MRQSNEVMPFPIGQIWWLQALILLSIWAPVLFRINEIKPYLNIIVILFCLGLGTIQLISSEALRIVFLGFNLYYPFFYTLFYITGYIYVTRIDDIKPYILFTIGILSLIGAILLVRYLRLNINYAQHAFPPDIYYGFGSIFTICGMLLFKNLFYKLIKRVFILSFSLDFFFKHTFSIYLLHTLAIYICEEYMWFIFPKEKGMLLGLIKFPVVLLITSLFSIYFTKLSKYITKKSNFFLDRISILYKRSLKLKPYF